MFLRRLTPLFPDLGSLCAAACLLLATSAGAAGAALPWPSGAQARCGPRPMPAAQALTGVVIDNGSGLSRETRVTAALLARAPESAWASPVMPELTASLPVDHPNANAAKPALDVRVQWAIDDGARVMRRPAEPTRRTAR
jgi:hypothetical protein